MAKLLCTPDLISFMSGEADSILHSKINQSMVCAGPASLERVVKFTDCFGSIKTSAEFAYRRLEQMIVMLELAPGSHTTEAELQLKVGVGRTPVREAIQRLAWEGLLEIRPRAGIAVAKLDGNDWLRTLEVRRHVELVQARAAARAIDDDAKKTLESALKLLGQAADAGDLAAYAAADKLFDIGMAEASRKLPSGQGGDPPADAHPPILDLLPRNGGNPSGARPPRRTCQGGDRPDPGRAVREARHLMTLCATAPRPPSPANSMSRN